MSPKAIGAALLASMALLWSAPAASNDRTTRIAQRLEALASGSRSARIEALNYFYQIGPEGKDSVPALVGLLRSSDAGIRQFSVNVLGRVGVPWALPALQDLAPLLADESAGVRQAASRTLGEFGTRSIEYVSPYLEHQLPYARVAALDALGGVRKDAAIATAKIVHLLKDPSVEVRGATVTALGRIGGPAGIAVPSLVECLITCNLKSRAGTIDAIKGFGADAGDAVPALVAQLKSSNQDERFAAAAALGTVRGQGSVAIPGLVDRLRTDPSPTVRYRSAASIGEYKADAASAQAALIDALRDPNMDVRQFAAAALSSIGQAAVGAIPLLVEMLDDEDQSVQGFAAESLADFGEAAVPALRSALADRRALVRAGSLNALSRMKVDHSGLAESIRALARDEATQVRQEALEVLGKMRAASDVALVSVVEALSDEQRPVRVASVRALTQLLEHIVETMPQLSLGTLRLLNTQVQAAEALSKQSPVNELQPLAVVVRGRSALEAEIRSRERLRGLRLALIAAVGGVTLAVLALSYANAGRLRRYMLMRRGYHWSFAAGRPSHVVDVHAAADHFRWVYRAATSVSSGGRLSVGSAPSDFEKALADLSTIVKGSDVLFEADDASFVQPWSHSIQPKWAAARDATVAGQIVRGTSFAPPLQRAGNISFAAVACYKSMNVSAILPNVDLEVAAVSKAFRRWGAQLLDDPTGNSGYIATRSDLRKALRQADIVHVAAHATPECIELSDGQFTVADAEALGASSIACRMLVLSACDSGQISESEKSLVRWFVLHGVTVIASGSPVSDAVCRVFFSALFDHFLPDGKDDHVELCDAIRDAASHCERRFGAAAPGSQQREWRCSIDAFVLYGSPNTYLQAKRS